MAKIGYLYLRRGEWARKQLLPPDWVEAANHATVNMNASFDPGLRYHNQFWGLPDRHVYMTVGYHCQVIMVLPDQDIVAAMTARDFCPFRKLSDDISGAVKSEAALPANPDAAIQLANMLGDISTEKPTEIGPTPEIASAISGKTYRFPDNALTVKSLSLSFEGPRSRYAIEIDTRNPANPVIRMSGPIGLDGLYRKSELNSFGLRAVKGSWVSADTFVIDVQFVGQGEQRKYALSFNGSKVGLRSKARDGREIPVEGEQAD